MATTTTRKPPPISVCSRCRGLTSPGDRTRFDTWVDQVETGKMKTATILDEDSYVVGTYVRPDGTVARYNAPLVKGFQGSAFFTELVLGNRVPVTIDQQVGEPADRLQRL